MTESSSSINCYWLGESIDLEGAELIELGFGIICILRNGKPSVYRVGFDSEELDISDVVFASCGVDHLVLLDKHGSVYAYGDNSHGQCGQNHSHSIRLNISPSELVCSGATCTICVTRDNTLKVFGSNEHSQLGSDQSLVPWHPNRVQMISSGYAHTCVLAGGVLYGTGCNSHGQLSFLTTEIIQKDFKLWTDSFSVRSVSCGFWTTAIVTDNGELLIVGKVPTFQGEPRPLAEILSDWKARSARKFENIGEWKILSLPEPVSEVKTGSSLALVLSVSRKSLFLIDLWELSIVNSIRVENAIRSFTVSGRNWAFI